MKNNTRPRRIALLLSMYGALLIFLATTNPKDVSSVLLALPIVWLFACLFLSMVWFNPLGMPELPGDGQVKRYAKAAIIAGIPSGLLLLQSINQLTPKDILLLAVFGGAALSYSRRFQLLQKRE